eukprot:COSAG02_NODE_2979_length_7625_cov_73.716715_8_plen_73_part_00
MLAKFMIVRCSALSYAERPNLESSSFANDKRSAQGKRRVGTVTGGWCAEGLMRQLCIQLYNDLSQRSMHLNS